MATTMAPGTLNEPIAGAPQQLSYSPQPRYARDPSPSRPQGPGGGPGAGGDGPLRKRSRILSRDMAPSDSGVESDAGEQTQSPALAV
jgi:hypothetical protein